jgi:hypothetical protein
MHGSNPLVITNELFASGERFFRIFAGILIRPLLSTVYVKDPLNDDMVFFGKNLFAPAFFIMPADY